jgi:hypothetical protein
MILLSASSSHLVLFWTIPNLNKRTERSEEKKSTYPSDLCCLSSIRAVEKVSGAGRSRPRELSKSPYTHALPPTNHSNPVSATKSACSVLPRSVSGGKTMHGARPGPGPHGRPAGTSPLGPWARGRLARTLRPPAHAQESTATQRWKPPPIPPPLKIFPHFNPTPTPTSPNYSPKSTLSPSSRR